jgi:hypothetical protein
MRFKDLPSEQKRYFFLKITIFIIILLLISSPISNAQARVLSALIKPDTGQTVYKTSQINNNPVDSLALVTFKPAKSGSLAMLFSAILPGAGQVYAERYYTIPLIIGFSTYYISEWIKANDTYQTYRNQFAASVINDTVSHTGDERIRSARDTWRNYRDGFVVYFAITYLLNIVDAYVGATLYNFDVSDNLGSTTATIRFRIPLH